MSTRETIENLQYEGYTVRVSHRRPWEDLDANCEDIYPGDEHDLATRHELEELALFYEREGLLRRLRFLPKGGLTTVKISRDGTFAVGCAICSPRDNYDRKLGAQIALGRALKQLWPE